jgi:GxxExxY protein
MQTLRPTIRLALPSDLSQRVIGCFFRVYNELGPGFLESVYARALAAEFEASGVAYDREVGIEVYYRDGLVGSFRADFVVEGTLLLELKAVSALVPDHTAQVLNYLSATSVELALLLNFGARRPQVRRLILTNDRKRGRRRRCGVGDGETGVAGTGDGGRANDGRGNAGTRERTGTTPKRHGGRD